MPLTDQQLRALTYLVLAARPIGARHWDEGGVYANLAKVRERDLGTVVIAAIQAAEDRNAATPGVIPKPGPHWRNPESAPAHVERPRFDPARTCSVCNLTADLHDRMSGDHEFVSVERWRAVQPTPPPETAREHLAAAQAVVCKHGVAPERCVEHKPARAPAEDDA